MRSTGSWVLDGGSINNGAIELVEGSALVVTSNFANRLSGVTLNADLALSASNAHLRLSNGVTVNGTITVSGSNAGLISDTTQTIGGSGTIQFEGSTGSERDLSVEGGTTLTLGENLTVRGGGAMIGGVFFVGGNSFLINRGTILADAPGQVLRIDAGGSGTFTNEGLVHATGGALTLLGSWDNNGTLEIDDATLNLDGTFRLDDLGTLDRAGGTVNLKGTLDNSGTTLRLDATTGSWVLDGGSINNGAIELVDGSTLVLTSNFANRLSGVTLNADLALSASNAHLRLSNGVTVNGTITVSGSNAGLISDTTQTIGGSGTIQFEGSTGSERDLSVEGGTTLTLGENLTVRGGGAMIGGVFFVGGNSFLINRGTILADAPGQVLRIDAGGSGTFTNEGLVHATGGALTLLGSWDNNGTLEIDDATLNLDGTFRLDDLGTLDRAGGTVNLKGTLDNSGTTLRLDATTGSWVLDGGSINNGAIELVEGATLVLASNFANRLSGVTLNADLALSASNAHLRLSNGVTVNGTITVSGSNAGLISDTTQTIGGSGTIQFEGSTGSERDLSVEGGTTLTLGENLTVRGGGAMIGGVFFVGGNSFLINRGTILADAPGQVLRIDAGGSGTFTNEGLVHATGGALTLLGSWDNNGTLEIDDATLNLDGTFRLDDLGTLDRAGGTVNLKGTLDNSGTTLLLDASTGPWVLDGGSINNGAIELVEGSALVVTSNFANRLSGVTLNADLALSASNAHLRLSNGVTVNGTITVSGSNAGLISDTTQTIGGSGTIQFEGGTGSERDLSVEGGTTLTLGENLTVRGGGAMIGGVFFVGGDSFLINRGTILADTPGQVLRIDAGGSGTFTNEGVLTGNSTIAGDIINAGNVQPGLEIGVLTIDGDYTQTSTGALQIEIAGPTAGTQHDQLVITGTASLAGTIEAGTLSGFDPTIGDQFTVLTFAAADGAFATTLSANLGPGRAFTAIQEAQAVRVDVIESVADIETIQQELQAGIDGLAADLSDIAGLFDLSAASGVDLPGIHDRLNLTLGLETAFGALGIPAVPTAGDLPSLATALTGLGLEVLCVQGGAPGTNACQNDGDLIELRYAPSPTDIEGVSFFDDDTIELLSELAPNIDVDGLVGLTGSLTVDFIFGFDTDGFFISGASTVDLAVSASGNLTAKADLVDDLAITATGTINTLGEGIIVHLASGSPSVRLRPEDDLSQILTPIVDAEVELVLKQTLTPVNVSWDGVWSLSTVDNVTTVAANVEFPTQDQFIFALLKSVGGEFASFFDAGIVDLFETLQLPLADGIGFSGPNSGGLAGDNGIEPVWFEKLLKNFEGIFAWDLTEEDAQLFLPEDVGLGRGLHHTAGDLLMGTNLLRQQLGLRGTGVKIGVISDGVRGLNTATQGQYPEIAPGSVEIFDQFPGGKIGNGSGAEGTAMIEIIQDIAPDAEFYFVGVGDPPGKSVDGSEAFLAGIDWFIENDVDIIVDDIGLPGEPFFANGSVAQKYREIIDSNAPNHDILFVSSAGNGNGSHYQAPLRQDVILEGELSSTLLFHRFRDGDNGHHLDITVPANGELDLILQWSGSFQSVGAQPYDFVLALLDEDGNRLRDQSGNLIFDSGPKDQAIRSLRFKNSSKTVRTITAVIGILETPENLDGAKQVPLLELFAFVPGDTPFGPLNTPTDSIYGHGAVQGVLTVGAISAADPGFDTPQPFSSFGPATFWDADTNSFVTRDNVLDVVAPDNVSVSGVAGFGSPFRGTSAAAPHAAGLAALLLEYGRSLGLGAEPTSEQLYQAISQSAVDLTLEPIAVDDSYVLSHSDGMLVIDPFDLISNDLDPDTLLLEPGAVRDTLKFIEAREINSEKFTTTGSVRFKDGLIHYTAPQNKLVLDRFEYVVEDQEGNLASGNVHIAVTKGDGPFTRNDEYAVLQGDELRFDPTINDHDPNGDVVSVKSVMPVSDEGFAVDLDDSTGEIVYRASESFRGIDVIFYTQSDGTFEVDEAVVIRVQNDADQALQSFGVNDIVLTDVGSSDFEFINLLENDIAPPLGTSLLNVTFNVTELDVQWSPGNPVIGVRPQPGVGHGSYEIEYTLATDPDLTMTVYVLVDGGLAPASSAMRRSLTWAKPMKSASRYLTTMCWLTEPGLLSCSSTSRESINSLIFRTESSFLLPMKLWRIRFSIAMRKVAPIIFVSRLGTPPSEATTRCLTGVLTSS